MCRLFAIKKKKDSNKSDFKKLIESFIFLSESGHNLVGTDKRGHKDGFGAVFYYNNKENIVLKSLENPLNLLDTINKNLNHDLDISLMHLRKSTIGEPSIANTHPFINQNISFIHNGSIAAGENEPYGDLAYLCSGETDSERFLMKIVSLKNRDHSVFQAYKETVLDILTKYKDFYSLNSILTDGENVYAIRVFNESHPKAKESFFEDYFTLYVGMDNDKNVYLSSEALSDTFINWTLLENYSILKIDKENNLIIEKLK